MVLSFDRTGFPLIPIPKVGYMHLLPITRFQFAQCNFLASAYEEACAAVQTAMPNLETELHLERLFVTGILPAEAEQFCTWLSEDQNPTFVIPDSAQWPALFQHVLQERVDEVILMDQCAQPEAHAMLKTILHERNPVTFLDLCMMESGVVEWVRTATGWTGRGKPRYTFSGSLFTNPTQREIKPINGYHHTRSYLFGFRPIQPF